MIADGGVSAVCQRAGAAVADPGHAIRVFAENPCSDFGHEAAVVVADDLPYDIVVLHLGTGGGDGGRRWRRM